MTHNVSIEESFPAIKNDKWTKPKYAYKAVGRFRSVWAAKKKFKGMQYFLGNYALQADAAFACDCAVKGLRDYNPTVNFEMKRDYVNARKLELENKGVSADMSGSLDVFIDQINCCCGRFPAAFNYSSRASFAPILQLLCKCFN
jgi:hypothetical protein